MKVSVVLPVYNKAPYLKACLDSIFAQTFGDFELLAVNDASTDESAQVLADCGDPRLRVLRLEHNQGPGLAAQRGMDEAVGEYVMRVDADDVLMPERFAAQVAFMDQHPQVGFCGTALSLLHNAHIVRINPATDADAKANLPFGVALFQPTLAMRRSVLVEHGIRYAESWPRYGEDWLLQAHAARFTEFANLPQPFLRYREGPQNVAHGRDRAADQAMLCKLVFPLLGFDAPDEREAELNALAVKVFRRPPDATRLRAFRGWLRHLAAMNEQRGVLDRQAFQRRLHRAWDELLYHLPQFGSNAVLAYLRLGPRINAARAYYLLRTALKRPANRAPKP